MSKSGKPGTASYVATSNKMFISSCYLKSYPYSIPFPFYNLSPITHAVAHLDLVLSHPFIQCRCRTADLGRKGFAGGRHGGVLVAVLRALCLPQFTYCWGKLA